MHQFHLPRNENPPGDLYQLQFVLLRTKNLGVKRKGKMLPFFYAKLPTKAVYPHVRLRPHQCARALIQ